MSRLSGCCLLLACLACQLTEEAAAGGSLSRHCGLDAFDSEYQSLLLRGRLFKRIVGGSQAKHGQWPWLVSLRFVFPNGTAMHACGGTLVHPSWIVTAAHCFEKTETLPQLSANPQSWLARIGEHDMTDADANHRDIPLSRIVIHPDRRLSFNDIAVVQLKWPAPVGRYSNVACLPTSREEFPVGSVCQIAGWGATSESDESHSMTLRHVSVPIVSHAYCSAAYNSLRDLLISAGSGSYANITRNMLCAGYEKGGRDGCQFDSGGPLLCRIGNSRRWQLVGVISYGFGCGRNGFPGVYTKVTNYADWIDEVIVDYEFR